MPKTRRKVNIIGHRNPDTDSICSALAYTYLKNQLGDAVYEARRAGQINRETAFVLKHFGVEPPRLCTDVSPQRIPDPFLDKRVCFYPSRLDIAQMRAAAKAFEGTHDFAAMRSVGTETKTTVRTVYWCDAEREGDLITVRVCANGFLYNMVRAMVGTMVYASYGKLRAEDIPALLEMRDRRLTGPTMPPQGLYMHRIWYDGPAGEMMADA